MRCRRRVRFCACCYVCVRTVEGKAGGQGADGEGYGE